MLNMNQMKDLDTARRDLENKKLILDTAIDIQALLRLLVDKKIITKEEVNGFRKEVRASSKWKVANTYIEQTMAEIKFYQSNPQLALKAMFEAKLNNQ
ncbi:MAG: hypothetical protein HFG88_10015 [Dorea sp.]|nr:hypothetical protein [Dorea sp.]